MLMTSSPLPPVTPRLRRGLGVGTRRAYEAKPGAMIEYSDCRKRPERESVERYRGPLSDGVDDYGLLWPGQPDAWLGTQTPDSASVACRHGARATGLAHQAVEDHCGLSGRLVA